MSIIRTLGFRTFIDNKGFDSGISKLGGTADRISKQVASRLEFTPKIADPSKMLGGATAADVKPAVDTAAIAGQADQIRSAMAGAMAPIGATIVQLGAKFEAMGQQMTATARRVDDHIRFPVFQQTIEFLRGIVRKNFAEMAGSAGRFARAVDLSLGGVGMLSKAMHSFGNLGRAGGPLDFGPGARSVDLVGKSAERATASMKSFGMQAAAALGLFGLGYKAVGFFKDGIKGASDLNESLGASDIILGAASADIKKYADTMAGGFGSVRREVIDMATSFGGVAKGVGKLDGGHAAAFGKTMTQLALDTEAIKNIPIKTIYDAISTGLKGNPSDVLEGLGVVIREDTVKAYALAHGIGKLGKELSVEEKFLVRSRMLTEGLAFANGNLAATIDDPAGAFRRLQGNIKNISTEVGSAFLPTIKVVAKEFNSGLGGIGAFFRENKPRVEAFANALGTGFLKAKSILADLSPTFDRIGAAISGAFAGGGGALASMMPSFEKVSAVARSAASTIEGAVTGIGGVIGKVFGPDAGGKVGEFVAKFGGIAVAVGLAVPVVSILAAGLGGLVAVLGSTPVLLGGIVAGVVALTSGFVDWGGVMDDVAFGIRNIGDLWTIAQVKVGGAIAYILDNAALIPTNLGIIGKWIGTNWLEIMLAPIKTIRDAWQELGKAIFGFFKNPKGGFHFDFDAVAKDMKAVAAKMPELQVARPLDTSSVVDDATRNIAAREDAHAREIARPPVVGPPAVTVPGMAAAGAGAAQSVTAAAGQVDAARIAEVGKFAADLMKDAQTGQEKYAEGLGKLNDAMKAGLIDAEGLRKGARKLFEDSDIGKRLEATRTPFEKFTKSMAEIRQALGSGTIDLGQANRLGLDAMKESGLQGQGDEAPKLAGAVSLGSADAYSAIVNAMSAGTSSAADKIAQQQLDVLKQVSKKLDAPAREPAKTRSDQFRQPGVW